MEINLFKNNKTNIFDNNEFGFNIEYGQFESDHINGPIKHKRGCKRLSLAIRWITMRLTKSRECEPTL